MHYLQNIRNWQQRTKKYTISVEDLVNYKYYDMDKVIEAALQAVAEL